MGDFDLYHSDVSTLAWDPTFVPEVGLKGLTWNSISIGWNIPTENFLPYIQYYKLNRKTDDQEVKGVCHLNFHYPVRLEFLYLVNIKTRPPATVSNSA